MKGIGIELIIISIGILLLFIGSKIANIGESVDSVISSKWTAISLIVIGGGLIAYKDIKR